MTTGREHNGNDHAHGPVENCPGCIIEELTNAITDVVRAHARYFDYTTTQRQETLDAAVRKLAALAQQSSSVDDSPAVEDSEAMRLLRIRHVEEIEALRRNEERWDHRAPAVEEQ